MRRRCERYSESGTRLPGLAGLVRYRVLRQGPAPNSTIPHLPVSVAGIAELAFASLVDLECAAVAEGAGSRAFVVEQAPPGLSDIAGDLVNKGCILDQPS